MNDATADARLGTVLAGERAGHYHLPGALLEAVRIRDAVEPIRIAAAERRLATIRSTAAEQAATALLAAIATGSPDREFATIVLKAEVEERTASIGQAIAEAAAERARADARRQLVTAAPSILIDELRPAHAATLAEVADLAPRLVGVDPDNAEAVLRAPKAAQDARARLVGLVERRDAILAAADIVRTLAGPPVRDTDQVFARFRAAADLWGRNWAARARHEAAGSWPWPTGHLAHLLWAATPQAGSWLPMGTEMDAALAEFLRRTQPGLIAGRPGQVSRLPWYAEAVS